MIPYLLFINLVHLTYSYISLHLAGCNEDSVGGQAFEAFGCNWQGNLSPACLIILRESSATIDKLSLTAKRASIFDKQIVNQNLSMV